MDEAQPKRLRFHIMIGCETRQIAKRLRDAKQLRLFLKLPCFLRWDAWHPIDEARVAAEIEITPMELNKALGELLQRYGGRFRALTPDDPAPATEIDALT
jgi:hypothetical protein